MTISRQGAHKLATEANKSGATVLGGLLSKEDGRYLINKTDLTVLLESLVDQNVLFFVGAVSEEQRELSRTCLTCGNEYTGDQCPRCARVRDRLRRG